MKGKLTTIVLTAAMACTLAGGVSRAEAAPLPYFELTGGAKDGSLAFYFDLDVVTERHASHLTFFRYVSGVFTSGLDGFFDYNQTFDQSGEAATITLSQQGRIFSLLTLSLSQPFDLTTSQTGDLDVEPDEDFSGAFRLQATPTGLSAVPLPSSAPMFGAAILALGAAGYARRRSLGVA